MHWACSHHALGRATQQIQDGDDGQPAGAASASSVEGVRRGRSDIWPYPMARSASPAASAHVGKPLDPSSRAQADSGCWGGFAWAGPVRRCWQVSSGVFWPRQVGVSGLIIFPLYLLLVALTLFLASFGCSCCCVSVTIVQVGLTVHSAHRSLGMGRYGGVFLLQGGEFQRPWK